MTPEELYDKMQSLFRLNQHPQEQGIALIRAAITEAVAEATDYWPTISCCQTAKQHVEHRISKAMAAERERCAKIAEDWPKDCNCSATDIGVGVLHEPGCGLPNPYELAAALRTEATGGEGKHEWF